MKRTIRVVAKADNMSVDLTAKINIKKVSPFDSTDTNVKTVEHLRDELYKALNNHFYNSQIKFK